MQWLEAVDTVQIVGLDPEGDWEIGEKVDEIFSLSNVRPDSTKNIISAAMVGDEVVGGVYAGWTQDYEASEEQNDLVMVFSFDVAVHPDYRGSQMIGIKLIEDTIRYYQNWIADYDWTAYIKADVINPRLVNILQRRFGFETKERIGDHVYMVRQ